MKSNTTHPDAGRRSRAGFTLIELLVTISIIALVLGIAGPTTIRLFSTSADTQAYNMFSTQLALARAGAIESANYVGLHAQITDSSKTYVANNNLSNRCVTAIVAWDEANNAFDLKVGEQPQEVPGTMAFGNVSSDFLSTNDYNLNVSSSSSNAYYEKFTTLTVLFNPDGELVRVTDNDPSKNKIVFKDTSSLFTGSSSIWDRDLAGANTGQQGASCVTMFNYMTFKSKISTTDAAPINAYLNESGQFIAANIYTGRLFPRE